MNVSVGLVVADRVGIHRKMRGALVVSLVLARVWDGVSVVQSLVNERMCNKRHGMIK